MCLPARKKKKNTKLSKTKKKQLQEELTGLSIGAIGIYIFLCIFTDYSGKWGIAIHDALFGSFGILAYILPFAVVFLAIAIIIKKKRKIRWGSVVAWSIFAICIICIFHIFFKENYNVNTFSSYVTTSFLFGKLNQLGSGALAAIISYPLIANIDVSGAYIVFATYMIALIIVKLRISLRKVTRDVSDKIVERSNDINQRVRTKTHEIRERRKLYINDLSQEEETATPEPTKSKYNNLKILTTNDFSQDQVYEAPIHEEPKEDYMPDFLKKKKKEEPSFITNQFDVPNEQEGYNPPEPFKSFEDIDTPVVKKKKEDTSEQEWDKAKASVGKLPDENPPYDFPPMELMKRSNNVRDLNAEAECRDNAVRLEETLASFGIAAKVMQVSRGPAVTRFELQPPPGVKISRITNLANDIALSLAAQGVRIEAPIPGKAAIGIEIPNDSVAIVKLRDIIESNTFASSKSNLSFALGKDITGKNVVADLAKMPHMLIAGATGSGKSVCINSIIVSLIYKSSPDDVRMIMIDPKRVELTIYNGIPHLLIPVVNDAKKAAGALNWAINEMTKRYQLFSENMARDIHRYNEIAKDNPELKKLPQIVIIIDELADLMAVAKNEVEDSIVRLAQLARAAGIHLIIATQRPSVDVITGIIKANIPARIAFAVYSQIDARTIMDSTGAEKLLGRGDMLFNPSGAPKPIRLQGAFITETEVDEITKFVKVKKGNYSDEIIKDVDKMQNIGSKKGKKGNGGEDEKELDNLIGKGIDAIFDMQQASISLVQRKVRVGYARAARIIDDIERLGIVGPKDGSKPREILLTRAQAHQKVEEYYNEE